MEYLLGIDLGGSCVKTAAVTPSGELLRKRVDNFTPDAALDWAKAVADAVAAMKEELGPPRRMGLSAPGLAHRDARSIFRMPGRLEGLEGLNWTEYLASESAVPVMNDAHAALLAEAWIGAAAGARDVVLLTLGTGVGGAVMVDGRLLKGRMGRAGHLGHNCLDPDGPRDVTGIPGSLEVMIGNCTIRERTQGRFDTTHALIEAFEREDEEATKYWLLSVQALACSISSFINMFDPEVVVVGGGIARAGKSLFEPLEKFLRPIEWQPDGDGVPVVPARLGEYAGAIGAARNALE